MFSITFGMVQKWQTLTLMCLMQRCLACSRYLCLVAFFLWVTWRVDFTDSHEKPSEAVLFICPACTEDLHRGTVLGSFHYRSSGFQDQMTSCLWLVLFSWAACEFYKISFNLCIWQMLLSKCTVWLKVHFIFCICVAY